MIIQILVILILVAMLLVPYFYFEHKINKKEKEHLEFLESLSESEVVIRKINFEDGSIFELPGPIILNKGELERYGYKYVMRKIVEAFGKEIKVEKVEE